MPILELQNLAITTLITKQTSQNHKVMVFVTLYDLSIDSNSHTACICNTCTCIYFVIESLKCVLYSQNLYLLLLLLGAFVALTTTTGLFILPIKLNYYVV